MDISKEKFHIDQILKGTRYNLSPIPVNTENEFVYKNEKYIISDMVKQYKVTNKTKKLPDGKWNDWTNEADMDYIYVIVHEGIVNYFDQDLYRINSKYITKSGLSA